MFCTDIICGGTADCCSVTLDGLRKLSLVLEMAPPADAPKAAGRPGPVVAADPLSRRQRAVAELIARGLTNREIAAELVLSERTVDAHVEHSRAKLGVRSRTQIATWLMQQPGASS